MTTSHHHTQSVTRREFLRLALALGATGVIAGTGGRQADAAPASASRPPLQLNLPPYPFFANLQSVMTEDRALLARLLAAYGRKTPAAAQHPIDFISRYVPSFVFEQTLQPSTPNDPSLEALAWLMHLAGYFGGVWLRTEFANVGVVQPAYPVSEASFVALAARISAAFAAFTGDNARAVAYARASLRGGEHLPSLTDSYGFNVGYLEQILGAAKPTNATAPAGYFTYNLDELYNGFYSVAEIRPLDNWRQRAAFAATRRGSDYAAIVQGTGSADTLLAIQMAGAGRGNFVWGPGNPLNFIITDFGQATYDLLLAMSVYYLQCTQATALAALAAASISNAKWARAAVRSCAMTVPFADSYNVGLFDETGQVPTFMAL